MINVVTAKERAAAAWFGEQEAKRIGAKRLYRERLRCPQCGPQIRLALQLAEDGTPLEAQP